MADHIQIPQTWMRNFNNKSNPLPNSVYCLSLDGSGISCVKIKELGAVENYYIRDFEHYLDINWETKIGEIFKKIRKAAKQGQFNLLDSEYTFIKRFLAISVSRSKSYRLLSYLKYDGVLPYIGDKEINPLSVAFSNGIMFENCDCQFVINRTNVGFILPSYSYYYADFGNHNFMPLTIVDSKIGIRFVERRKDQTIVQGSVIEILDDNTVKQFNCCALLVELNTNNDFLIAENIKDFAFEPLN